MKNIKPFRTKSINFSLEKFVKTSPLKGHLHSKQFQLERDKNVEDLEGTKNKYLKNITRFWRNQN